MKIEKIKSLFSSKTIWTRIIITLLVVGFILIIILKDNSCSYKDISCDSKSKINVEVGK